MNFETLEVSWSFGTFLILVSPKFFFNNWKLVNFHGTQLLLISANEADKALSAALLTCEWSRFPINQSESSEAEAQKAQKN